MNVQASLSVHKGIFALVMSKSFLNCLIWICKPLQLHHSNLGKKLAGKHLTWQERINLKKIHKSIKSLFLHPLSVSDQSCRAWLLRYYMHLVSSAVLKTAKINPSIMISFSFGAYPFLLELASEMHPSVRVALQLGDLTGKQRSRSCNGCARKVQNFLYSC